MGVVIRLGWWRETAPLLLRSVVGSRLVDWLGAEIIGVAERGVLCGC